VLGIEMKHLKNNKKKNNEIVITTTTLFTIATILVFATIVIPSSQQLAYARLPGFSAGREVPPAITGDNIYIAWWTNNTENGNEEVMFRASNDGGATFSDKINLSNTTDADSWRAEIAGEGDNVAVSWWETNQTSDIPVARVSNDGGETFGPLLMLGANGTLGSGEAEEIGVAAGEEGGG
jgi:hypothetical protein